MKQINLSVKITNEEILKHLRQKRTLPNNILLRKVNRIKHVLKRNCLLHGAKEGRLWK